MSEISKEFMEENYDLDFENLPLIRSIKREEWEKEVKAMIELANIELSKKLPINPEVNHWIDQYHKKLVSLVETKIKDLEVNKNDNM
jgi:hypothetical protein